MRKLFSNTGVRSRCSVHLINEGITMTTNAIGDLVTVIEWGLSTDVNAVTSEIDFTCCLDGAPLEACKQTTILTYGYYNSTAKKGASINEGCLMRF